MAITYLKQAQPRPAAENSDIRDTVAVMLANIERDGEDAVRRYAEKLDGWTGPIVVTDAQRKAACNRVSQQMKEDIQFAHANIRRFAEAQKTTMGECEVEVIPGLIAGQKQIPVSSAGSTPAERPSILQRRGHLVPRQLRHPSTRSMAVWA